MRMSIFESTYLRFFREPAFPLFLIATVIIFGGEGVGVGLSDGASVRIPGGPRSEGNLMESIESLAASRILMDHTSSSSSSSSLSTSMFKVTRVTSKSSSSLEESVVDKTGVAAVTALTKTVDRTGSQREDEDTPRSPLLVAQCRATCLQKFVRSSSMEPSKTGETTVVSASKGMDEKASLGPNLLRLRRQERSVGNVEFHSSSSDCFHYSDCLSCWKSCQLLEISSTEASSSSLSSHSGPENHRPEAVFLVGHSPPPRPSTSLKSTTRPLQLSGERETGEVKVNDEQDIAPKKEEETKSKHPVLACSKNASKQQRCLGGCQVACSFYEQILTKTGNENEQSFVNKTASDEPVVATKHKYVVKIVPGKLTWPAPTEQKDLPVVYVVIQEYPERKWKQIAQTTKLELGIPTELTTVMKMKLRSVRVLVVGPEGLRSVYSPLENTPVKEVQFSAEKKSNKFGKLAVAVTIDDVTTTTAVSAADAVAITSEINDDSVNTDNKHNNIANVRESSKKDGNVMGRLSEESGTMPTTSTSTETDSLSSLSRATARVQMAATTDAAGIVVVLTDEPFELRLVSLIHQKSLVIAELRWDAIGSNPNQEYLITWELTGGGLKGHLVTDSTSVTLSLWPDTTYQIQVEQFQQNFLDSDGEQREEVLLNSVLSSPSSLKSLPLIVDTSVASFPLERPSALLSIRDENDGEENDYQHDEDEFSAEEESEEVEDFERSGHKSVGQILGVALASLLLVLGILTLVAFTWIKLRILFDSNSCEKGDEDCDSEDGESGCFSCCFSGCATTEDKDIRLIASSREDLYSEDSPSFYASPMHYVLSLKKSQYSKKVKGSFGGMLGRSFCRLVQREGSTEGQQDEESVGSAAVIVAPVAVISSSFSSSSGSALPPSTLSNCCCNNALYCSNSSSSGLHSASSLVAADSEKNCRR